MTHQPRVQSSQGVGRAKRHVGRPLGLLRRPIRLGKLQLLEQLHKSGMVRTQQSRQQLGPVGLHLCVEQLLRGREVRHPSERVVLTNVLDPRLVHLFGQPFPTVHAHLDLEGKPRLDANVQPTQLRVANVQVVMQTLPEHRTQFQFLLLTIAVHAECPAGLDTTEHRDQTREIIGHLVLTHEPGDDFLLALGRRVHVMHLTHRRPGREFLGQRLQLLGVALQERGQVLEQNLENPQQAHHALGERNRPTRAAKANAVESGQDTIDIGLMTL